MRSLDAGAGAEGVQIATYNTDLFADKASAFIQDSYDTDPNKPFFLYYALQVPSPARACPYFRFLATHATTHCGGRGSTASLRSCRAVLWAQNVHEPLEYPATYLTDTPCSTVTPAKRGEYCALLMAGDQGVKTVMDKIRALGIEDDTVVILTSDNGGAPSESLPQQGVAGWGGGAGLGLLHWHLEQVPRSQRACLTCDVYHCVSQRMAASTTRCEEARARCGREGCARPERCGHPLVCQHHASAPPTTGWCTSVTGSRPSSALPTVSGQQAAPPRSRWTATTCGTRSYQVVCRRGAKSCTRTSVPCHL